MKPRPKTYDDVVGLRVYRNYLADPIPGDEVDAILEAARWTGSSKNTQKWSFVVIDDEAQLEELATAGSFARPILAATLAIAIVWPPDGYEFDIGRVAQNMMLAAAGPAKCSVSPTAIDAVTPSHSGTRTRRPRWLSGRIARVPGRAAARPRTRSSQRAATGTHRTEKFSPRQPRTD